MADGEQQNRSEKNVKEEEAVVPDELSGSQRQPQTNEKKKKTRKERIYEALPQVIAVSIKNVLLMGYGMTLGFPTILIPALQGGDPHEQILLSQDQISWISSINLICVPVGCLLSGIVTQPIGRKRSMQLVNIPFMAAWILLYFSLEVSHLYAALALTGLAGGLMEAPVITYVAEITQPHLRGMLSATSSMTIIIGVFSQFLLGTFLSWRWLAIVDLVAPVLAALLLYIVPESPHWLILKGRYDEARKALAWLRGWTDVAAIENEFKDLCVQLGTHDDAPKPKIMDLMKRFIDKSVLNPYLLIAFAFFVGQFSGTTTLQIYAVPIFLSLKSPIDEYYATMLLGIVELLAAIICVVTIHKVGKRPLAFTSTIGIGICTATIAIYAYTNNITTLDFAKTNITQLSDEKIKMQWLPTTALISTAFVSHLGIRLLPWVLIGELYPADVRAFASGLSGSIGYIFSFTASKIFLSMIHTLTLPGTFIFYSLVTFGGVLVLYFALPETEGRTLHDIELHFLGVQKIKRTDGVYKKNKKKNDLERGEINHAFSEKSINGGDIMNSRL